MSKYLVAELEGQLLNLAVAHVDPKFTYYTQWRKCWHDHEITEWYLEDGELVIKQFDGSRSRAGHWAKTATFEPSTNPEHGWPYVERELDGWSRLADGRFMAFKARLPIAVQAWGATALVAAMRCYVASVVGEYVELPV